MTVAVAEEIELETASLPVNASDDSASKRRLFTAMLLLPLLFFAVHGFFSLMGDGDQSVAMSQATVMKATSHQRGIFGAVILPGIAYGVVLWALLTNYRGVLQMTVERKLFTFLAFLTMASALWSQDPVRSFYSGGFYLIGTLFAYYLVLRFSSEEIMGLMMRLGVLVVLLDLVMVFVFPHWGVSNSDPRTLGAWNGIFEDRVTSAKTTVFLLSPALIFTAARSRWRNVIYAIALLAVIVMAKAVTALGVVFAFAAIMTMVQLSRRLERKTALFFGSIVGVVAVTFFLFGDTLIAPVLALFGRDMSLTGRTEIWALLFDSIAKHPTLGYGYYAFWQGMEGESGNVITAAHWFFGYAHNGLLEIVLQLGLFGTTIFLATLVMALKNAWFCFKYGRTAGIEWYFGVLVLSLLYNVDEETVMWPNDLLSILYIVACCGLAVEAKRIRTEQFALHAASLSQSDPYAPLELAA
ncbi:O-antigen ligase family protein [Granulicella paludicola]|uniref:O-antigen ligase family protein n=1 Tax=Granulicella paludicola TaxID=474951 RepID=UPI0021DFAB75|nr:O-antigen ligase family protein [Granulicella paludicola]